MKAIKLSRKHKKMIKNWLTKFKDFFESDIDQFIMGVLFGMLITMLVSFINC